MGCQREIRDQKKLACGVALWEEGEEKKRRVQSSFVASFANRHVNVESEHIEQDPVNKSPDLCQLVVVFGIEHTHVATAPFEANSRGLLDQEQTPTLHTTTFSHWRRKKRI